MDTLSAMFSVGQRRLDGCLVGALLLALSGCTAILDFSEPIDKTDAGPSAVDASVGPDALNAVCASFEPNDTIADAKNITPMDVASATCSATDTDIFSFMVGPSQDVTITLSFTGNAGDDLHLGLLDGDGATIVESSGIGNTEQIVRSLALTTALAEGTYHIEVQPNVVTGVIPYSVNLAISAQP